MLVVVVEEVEEDVDVVLDEVLVVDVEVLVVRAAAHHFESAYT